MPGEGRVGLDGILDPPGMADLLVRDTKRFETELKAKADIQLEVLRNNLQRDAGKELELLRHQLQQGRDTASREAEAASQKKERIRLEILRWANPILGAVTDLQARLENILNDSGNLALQRSPRRPLPPSWSVSYDYMALPRAAESALGVFAWGELLRQ